MSKIVTCPNCNSKFDISITPTSIESKYLWIFDNGHGGVIDGVIRHQVRDHQSGLMAMFFMKESSTER